MRFILALLLLTGLTACTTPRFDPAAARRLQPGVSTLSDAEKVLGTPTARSAAANGGSLVQWMDIQGSPLGRGYGAHIAILFDSDGRMVRLTHEMVTP